MEKFKDYLLLGLGAVALYVGWETWGEINEGVDMAFYKLIGDAVKFMKKEEDAEEAKKTDKKAREELKTRVNRDIKPVSSFVDVLNGNRKKGLWGTSKEEREAVNNRSYVNSSEGKGLKSIINLNTENRMNKIGEASGQKNYTDATKLSFLNNVFNQGSKATSGLNANAQQYRSRNNSRRYKSMKDLYSQRENALNKQNAIVSENMGRIYSQQNANDQNFSNLISSMN